MEVINEAVCPNCKATIQEVCVRHSYIKKRKHKRGAKYSLVKGVYKWIVRRKLSQKGR